MLIATLCGLFERGVTSLPLHDSVLVAESQAAAAEQMMHATFTHFTGGARASIKTTISQ